MQSLPVYSEPALGCPLFSASPDRGFSRFSAGEMLTLAVNFLQKQQKQRNRRFGVDCGWWAGSGLPGAKLSYYPRCGCTSTMFRCTILDHGLDVWGNSILGIIPAGRILFGFIE
jgi:hypothetical protein